MKTLFRHRCGKDKFAIAMVRALALPGAPKYDRTGELELLRLMGRIRA